MLRECGKQSFPIWLLGDSEPKNWRDVLDTPFDTRHPTRHNIWTAIIEVMQDKVYREDGRRIDTSNIYIRNAIGDPDGKPKSTDVAWPVIIQKEIEQFSILVKHYQPFLVLSFGAFAFEFANRACGKNEGKYGRWGAKELGKAFTERISGYKDQATNTIPLLHRSISGGNFLKSHDYFVGVKQGNYFEYVGKRIANVLLDQKNHLNIWI